VLITSDLHYRLPTYDWLAEIAERFDAVALVGDLLDVASRVPIDTQIVVIDAYLDHIAAAGPLLVASGNHDLDGPGPHGEQMASWLRRPRTRTVITDGQTADLAGIRFTVCPWWDGPVTRDEVDGQLRTAAPSDDRMWIWLYHAPPAGTPLCRDGRRSFPDPELAAWIQDLQPDMVMCGHIHQAPWADGGSWHARIGRTFVFNAGHVRSRVPPHIVIDTDLATAEWNGLDDWESLTLTGLRRADAAS
jgi:Icc-related predicted phosphoesterase